MNCTVRFDSQRWNTGLVGAGHAYHFAGRPAAASGLTLVEDAKTFIDDAFDFLVEYYEQDTSIT